MFMEQLDGTVLATALPTCAPWFLKCLGFKPVLTWIGALATVLLALSAAFRPDWPLPLIYGVLIANGFFQSLQFMAYNTIAYADVPREQMSAATSFYTNLPADVPDPRHCVIRRGVGGFRRRQRSC